MPFDKDSLADKENVTSKQRTNGEVQLPRRKGDEGSFCSRGILLLRDCEKLMGIHCEPWSKHVLLCEDPLTSMKV